MDRQQDRRQLHDGWQAAPPGARGLTGLTADLPEDATWQQRLAALADSKRIPD